MFHAYLFEVRGVQRFLFASGKLRDMLAGSELLDHICASNGLLDAALAALQLTPHAIPRRAGATFYLVFADKSDAERFRASWRLAFPQWVPGVESVDALTSGDGVREAIANGINQLAHRRNLLQADLPRPGPLSELSPRTGLPAVSRSGGESLDRGTARLRQFRRPADSVTLEDRFLDEPGYHWPRNFEASGPIQERFPLQRNRMVGLIHADGNGIGQVLRALNKATANASDNDYVKVYSSFSEHLARITMAAAQAASRDVLLPRASDHKVLPARPLVLGGDDMSILVRADLALDYSRQFMREFEARSADAMQSLKDLLGACGLGDDAAHLPDRLTASAGICFIKCSYPFQSAHALAESLCKRAKAQARQQVPDARVAPSTIAFHKMEGAVAEDADVLFKQFHYVDAGADRFELALPAYAIDPTPGLPCLDDLQGLAEVFSGDRADGINDRPLRELATLWRQDIGVAREAYARWRQLAERSHAGLLKHFDQRLEALLGKTRADLPASDGRPAVSPLSDLLIWLAIQAPARRDEDRQ